MISGYAAKQVQFVARTPAGRFERAELVVGIFDYQRFDQARGMKPGVDPLERSAVLGVQ